MEETFRYKVELDTQGLAGQLAGVRDFVSSGLNQAASGVAAGAQVVSGAFNRMSSDLMQGQQFISSAIPSQTLAMAPNMGMGATPLGSIPGMPQTFMQDVFASMGLSRPPIGVFDSQHKAVARAQLQERLGVGLTATATTAASMLTFGAAGAAIGSAILPGIGTIVGAIGGAILGDTVLAPINDGVQRRMQDRAQIQQLFGFNKFNDDERMNIANFMGQSRVKSIFSPDEFNSILPAAAKAGMFKGLARGDTAGFQSRFAQAEQTFAEDMYTLQLSGPEGFEQAASMRRGFARMGVTDQRAISRHFSQARVITQDMAEMGEFADPQEVIQAQVAAGSTAMQFGLSARSGMETFSRQAAMTNRLRASGKLSDDDFAQMGGTTGDVSNRLTTSLMASQRHPVFRAAAMAFGDVSGGIVGINRSAMEAGGMSFASMTAKLAQNLGTGMDGTTKMMTLMANEGKLKSDMMANQGQMLRGMTDDILKQTGIEATDGTRQFVMQKMFGVGESESRALVAGLPMEKADKARLETESAQFDREVKGAITEQGKGPGKWFDEVTRGIKEGIASPLDRLTHSISTTLVPSIDKAVERLGPIEERVGTAYRSNSPISVGPIDFRGNDGKWMVPPDPMSLQGFRAVEESRRFPAPLSLVPTHAPKVGLLPGMSRSSSESMAG